MAVYFPRGQQDFKVIEHKFLSDLDGNIKNKTQGMVFVTNQELRLAERKALSEKAAVSPLAIKIEIFHLERITAILDRPNMATVRKQFLDIDVENVPGEGGKGGNAKAKGNNSQAVGGRGGTGGISGKGGNGGHAEVDGDNSFAMGGDGGSAAQADGRGGIGAIGAMERMNGPTSLWQYGAGGSGANAPEYNRRLSILTQIRQEYMQAIPDRRIFIEAGIDIVPLNWVNKRLEELGEKWLVLSIKEGGGYLMPNL